MISTRPVTLIFFVYIPWYAEESSGKNRIQDSGDHKTMLSNFKRIKLWCLCGGRNTGMQKAWYKQPVLGEWVSLIRQPDHWTAPKMIEVYLFQCLCRARTRNEWILPVSTIQTCGSRCLEVQRFSKCWQVSLHFHSTNCFHFFRSY